MDSGVRRNDEDLTEPLPGAGVCCQGGLAASGRAAPLGLEDAAPGRQPWTVLLVSLRLLDEVP